MRRLTYKLDEPIDGIYLYYEYMRIADYDIDKGNFGRITDAQIYNKLGKLEDLEDELGCSLNVIFKAIENGIVILGTTDKNGNMTLWETNRPLIALKEERSFEEPKLIKYNDWCFDCCNGEYSGCVRLKDYGKTWWIKDDWSE